MIAYVKGELAIIEEDKVIVEVNGIGYQIFMPVQAIGLLPNVGEEIRLHTYMHVKEDAMQLFGFLTKDDLKVFKLLITVSGIGPKGALSILSQLSPDDLRFAIMANDIKAIASAPGIGKKTAEKLIVELRDKLTIEEVLTRDTSVGEVQRIDGYSNEMQAEAIQALVALGYGSTEATKAVKKVNVSESTTVETLLKDALKNMIF